MLYLHEKTSLIGITGPWLTCHSYIQDEGEIFKKSDGKIRPWLLWKGMHSYARSFCLNIFSLFFLSSAVWGAQWAGSRGERGRRWRLNSLTCHNLAFKIQKRWTSTLVLEELINISNLGTGGGIEAKAIELNES